MALQAGKSQVPGIAVAALLNLALLPTARAMVAKEGAIPPLCRVCVESKEAAVLVNASGALANLSLDR